MNFLRITILLFSIYLPVFIYSQTIKTQRQDLDRIREEIMLYENRLKSEVVKEANILDILSDVDREIDLTHELLEELQKEESKQSKTILGYAHNIKGKRLEIDKLKEIYKNRLIYFYKHGRRNDLELLLSARSFNQVLSWLKYQKLLAENDRRNYHNILKKKKNIEQKKDKLKTELLSKRQIIREKDEEEEKLRQRKKERSQLLAQVRQNKELYLAKLKEYEISAKEIERLIAVEEERRANLGLEGMTQQTDFPKLKGNLIWPANGKIITGFGKYKHPQLKTITESIGVDIQSQFGNEVKVVGNGVVTAITWQRGRGNIIIISHFGGYYTVYTHLSNIFVNIDDEVLMGQVIGEVGDTGSLKGAMLHFEIWHNNKVLNPEQWLG